jgi:anti-sigma regulatory factor (Ser/Thr protein kinase)
VEEEHRRFDAQPREIQRARFFVSECLQAWMLPAEVSGFELTVSELVTNAIIHGTGEVDVVLTLDGPRLRMEVSDQGSAPDAAWDRTDLPATGIGGWGLQLIDRLMDSWGTERAADHTTIWVERQIGLTQDESSPPGLPS